MVIGFVGDRGRDDRGGGGGDMMEMVDTIFVSGLPEDIDEDGLVQHFGSIGVIKTDKRTGKQKFGSTKTKTLVGQKEKPQSLMMTVKQPRQLSTGSMRKTLVATQ